MSDVPAAPSLRLADALLESLDNGYEPLRDRLADLTDREYLWEPAPNCWTVRRRADGTWRVDEHDREADPAPVTTIACRIWHLAWDCFDSYSRSLFDRTGTDLPEGVWVGDAAGATVLLEQSWSVFRHGVVGWGDDLWELLGPSWGQYAQHARIHLMLHAERELIHHAAEIMVLRDLYQATGAT